MTRAEANDLANQRRVLAWLAAPAQNDLIATTAEIVIAVSMLRETVWACCEALEKLGHVEWCAARRDSDRPGGWSSTQAGRAAIKETTR